MTMVFSEGRTFSVDPVNGVQKQHIMQRVKYKCWWKGTDDGNAYNRGIGAHSETEK